MYKKVKGWQCEEEVPFFFLFFFFLFFLPFFHPTQVLDLGGRRCPSCSASFFLSPASPSTPTKKEATGTPILCPVCGVLFCDLHERPFDSCSCPSPSSISSLPPREDLQKVLEIKIRELVGEGATQTCPKCHAVPGQKDDGCTHMNCDVCGCSWCYFCGGKRKDWCKKGCPWYLENCGILGKEAEGALVKFHKLKCVRLLRDLRNDTRKKAGILKLNRVKLGVGVVLRRGKKKKKKKKKKIVFGFLGRVGGDNFLDSFFLFVLYFLEKEYPKLFDTVFESLPKKNRFLFRPSPSFSFSSFFS